MVKEYLLKTDSFLNPKVLSGKDAIGVLIIRLLLLIPGTNPRHPKMGVGIGTKYKFIMSNQLETLRGIIQDQMSTYFPPEFQASNVNLEIDDKKCLVIKITIQDVEFIIDTNDLDAPVQLSEVITEE